MANRRLQVFVSSTFTDMQEERQAAVQAILKAGHFPAGMELFKAGDKSQWETIERWIQESDVYLLLLGGRYGSIDEGSGISYTEKEYDYAISLNKPIFAAVIDDSSLAEKAKRFSDPRDAMEMKNPHLYTEFKRKVLSYISEFYNDIKDIKIIILGKLADYQDDESLIGWVRGDKAKTPEELEKVNAMYEEIETLKKKLIVYEERASVELFEQDDDVLEVEFTNSDKARIIHTLTWGEVFISIARYILSNPEYSLALYKLSNIFLERVRKEEKNITISFSDYKAVQEAVRTQFIALELIFVDHIQNSKQSMLSALSGVDDYKEIWKLTPKGIKLYARMMAKEREEKDHIEEL